MKNGKGSIYAHKEMAGISGQHITIVKKDEDDPRRHPHRCIHHRVSNEPKGHCALKKQKCIGTSHCDEYCEKSNGLQNLIDKYYYLPQGNTKKKVALFEGTKPILITDLEELVEDIDVAAVNKMTLYYKQYKKFPDFVAVECIGNKYRVAGGESIVRAAKILNLKTIDAQIMDKELYGKMLSLKTVGTLVYNRKMGDDGEVVKVDNNKITILYDNGKRVMYEINHLFAREDIIIL